MPKERCIRKRLEKTLSLHLRQIHGTETAYNNKKPKTINKKSNKNLQQILQKGEQSV